MPKKKVNVKLTKKSNGTYKLTIDPIVPWMASANENIVWTSDEADLEVRFDKGDGSPFGTALNPKAVFTGAAGTENCDTGLPWDATEKPYGFTLKITPNPRIPQKNYRDMPPIVLDPDMVVDDGGPPGGKKKAAKKKSAKKKAGKKKAARRARRTGRKKK